MTHTMPWSESSGYRQNDEVEASDDLDGFDECRENSVNEILENVDKNPEGKIANSSLNQ